MTIDELRRFGAETLRRESLERGEPEVTDGTCVLEADLLLGHVLSCRREALVMRRNQTPVEGPLEGNAEKRFRELVSRRAAGEPIAYLLGKKEFHSLDFIVSPAVLIPRPETELLVERALAHFSRDKKPSLLIDIGTGSGAVLLSVLHEIRRVHGEIFLQDLLAIGSDISREALEIACRNAEQLGLRKYVQFVRSDFLSAFALEEKAESLKVIVCNPPYIPHRAILSHDVKAYEPHQALFAGEDGLSAIRTLVAQSYPQPPSGALGLINLAIILEVGAEQAEKVRCLFLDSGARDVAIHRDLRGIDRVVEILS